MPAVILAAPAKPEFAEDRHQLDDRAVFALRRGALAPHIVGAVDIKADAEQVRGGAAAHAADEAVYLRAVGRHEITIPGQYAIQQTERLDLLHRGLQICRRAAVELDRTIERVGDLAQLGHLYVNDVVLNPVVEK